MKRNNLRAFVGITKVASKHELNAEYFTKNYSEHNTRTTISENYLPCNEE